MEIKTILKNLLNEKDINVAQLSRATEVPRQTLDNWLSGQDPRSFDQVKIIADFFGVTMDELCFGQKIKKHTIQEYNDEINAGVFEVVLRRIKK